MRTALIVAGTAMVLTVATLALIPQVAEGTPRLLPPDKARLVAEKDQARSAARIPNLTQPGPFIGPNEPYRASTHQVANRRADVIAEWRSRAETYARDIERVSGPAAAAAVRSQLAEDLRTLEALPEEFTTTVSAIEGGRRSYQVSTFTDNYVSAAVDPINTFFYRKGTAWDVQYDMKNWTTRRLWVDTSGSPQRVHIWDGMHTGGWDGWRGDQHQLKPSGAPEYPEPRYHIRLFGSFVQDSHSPGAGWWTVGDAHWDNQGHNCSSWEDAEAIVRDSFRDGSGNPMWFVGQIYTSWFQNAGWFQCGNNDGYATFIELIY